MIVPPGSILAVLNDPGFEHRQPSWVRRSLRRSQIQQPSSAALDTPLREDEAKEEVDLAEFTVVMEFVREEESQVGWPVFHSCSGKDQTLSIPE